MRWVGLFALAGCVRFFGLDPPTTRDADGDGATVCTNASLTCASADVLRNCAAAGELASDTQCAWGCLDGAGATPHCGQLAPSGGAVDSPDLVADSALMDVALPGDIAINSDTGQITIGNATLRAGVTGVDAGIDYQVRGTVAVFRFRSLTITGPVIVVGNHAAAFVADGSIEVANTIDMSGLCGNAPAPGGFPGGARGQDATGSGAGLRGAGNSVGGGGGGHGGVGGAGGTGGGTGSLNGGPMFGDPRISNLIGGGGGGGGADQNTGGAGGGGGGALQIASNAHITIASAGGINAGGCGGKAASSTGAGGGGGAGGAILLEAPVITIAGALAVNGGGGGASGGNGQDGAKALLSTMPAQGGTSGGGGGGADGGNGAAAAAHDGSAGQSGQKGGGGGGAIGRMRFNTRAGVTSVDPAATLSPNLTDNSTTTEAAAEVK